MRNAGTDVSKEAAKMILIDDNFATIILAIREGRRVWDNLVKILLYNMPANFSQGFAVFMAYVFSLETVPLTAIQVPGGRNGPKAAPPVPSVRKV